MTGDRRSLISGRPKGKTARKAEMQTLCKGGFPLENEMTHQPLFGMIAVYAAGSSLHQKAETGKLALPTKQRCEI